MATTHPLRRLGRGVIERVVDPERSPARRVQVAERIGKESYDFIRGYGAGACNFDRRGRSIVGAGGLGCSVEIAVGIDHDQRSRGVNGVASIASGRAQQGIRLLLVIHESQILVRRDHRLDHVSGIDAL